MKKKWEKGDPLSISDLLKITPLANEALVLSEDLKVSLKELWGIIAELAEKENDAETMLIENSDDLVIEPTALDSWDDDLLLEEDLAEDADYVVSVRLQGMHRFPAMEFRVGVNDQEDISYFFDMIVDMMDKMEQ
jgi:hypothetical protein